MENKTQNTTDQSDKDTTPSPKCLIKKITATVDCEVVKNNQLKIVKQEQQNEPK
jgi:hypothetical protein